ncbi:hypothetical protein CDD80_2301 [Ophiocordyceps camponoti-rufipedis]|uniref:Uncharacterized protein n=1 Tax=Ophiocordyceps camponoti-rufipedis TaxID=2004952 RepID=A0A2C5Z6B7_9HYPO|nr:hypothetical protein CDD80_2301 [Ophiocordyceps camponoti-rufipedis]
MLVRITGALGRERKRQDFFHGHEPVDQRREAPPRDGLPGPRGASNQSPERTLAKPAQGTDDELIRFFSSCLGEESDMTVSA